MHARAPREVDYVHRIVWIERDRTLFHFQPVAATGHPHRRGACVAVASGRASGSRTKMKRKLKMFRTD
eukprot:896947-Prymnesium_polylepis.1